MFYLDNEIINMENNREYIKIVKYLDDLFSKNKDANILMSTIGYSWYLFVEAPCLFSILTNEELDYLRSVWLKYNEIGLNCFQNNAEVCFLLGYTFYLHGFFINNSTKNEMVGLELIEKSLQITNNEELKSILEIFIRRHKNKKTKKISCPSKLFKTNSILDTYFKEIFYD